MKPEPEKDTICPQCGLKTVVKKETKRATGLIVTRYQCKNPVCQFKFTPTKLKAATKGKKHVTGRTTVDLDKAREAKLPGKRVVKHLDADGKLLNTTEYYERRRNRADIDPKKRL